MRSVAALCDAAVIAHSAGHGTSGAFAVAAFDASETAKPSLTSAAAALRFAGVIRLSAPISSSLPQRPQLVSSVCHFSYWPAVTSGWFGEVCGVKPLWENATLALKAAAITSARPQARSVFVFINTPRRKNAKA